MSRRIPATLDAWREAFLAEIEAFCGKHGISPSRFGREALSDKHFVKQFRNGRQIGPDIERRVREYMAGYKAAA